MQASALLHPVRTDYNGGMETIDVVIIGGSLAGVAAALELRKMGKRVVLVTHRSYLGEDLCDSMRLALPENMDLSDPVAQRLFGTALDAGRALRPMHLKHELDVILQEADIPVVLCAAPVSLRFGETSSELDILTRSGVRTLKSARFLDATVRGELLRMAGVAMTEPASSITVARRVIGGDPEGDTHWVQEGEVEFTAEKQTYRKPLWVTHQKCSLKDGSWPSWMELEQDMRLKAYRPGQDQSADGISAWTGERLHPDQEAFVANGDPQQIPLSAATAIGGVLAATGRVVNVEEETRKRLERPDVALMWGRTLAKAWMQTDITFTPPPSAPNPRLEMEVLVIGGGTGGAPAGVGAARSGVRTLVAEVLSGLGGVGTLGLIGRYWFGNRVGFTAEVDAGADDRTSRVVENGWDIEAKMQWYHEQISQAGGAIWYKTALMDVLTDGNRVTGAVLATPQGPVTVTANCVVDATGAGEVAARAGAEMVETGQGKLAIQGTGLPGRNPREDYHNTDYDFIDESNAEDAATAHVTARRKFKAAFDAGQLIDSRERRRIVGDMEVSPMDIRLGRVFPDTIVKARSNFDTHGYTLHPLFMIVPPDHEPLEAYIPLRALLPKGIDGVLVTGLGISAHRDAMPVIRMQADVQNQGYAAGVIAAKATDGRIRNLDLEDIQTHLVERGILEPELKGAGDSFPLPESDIAEALRDAPRNPEKIDRLFTLPDAERNARLRRAFAEAEEEEARRFYSFVLGILGDASGQDTLEADVASMPWDEGWDYTGMGQFGASMSPLDSRIIALGRCAGKKSVEMLISKAGQLPSPLTFSHVRALCDAFTELGDPSGTTALEGLLQRENVSGHTITTQEERDATATESEIETRFRNDSLIELHLATALVRLQPDHPTGVRTLEAYTRDLRGLYARHAQRVLTEGNH